MQNNHHVSSARRRPHPRAGVSLVEMLVVITVAAVMVALAVSTIHLLLRAEHEATNSARCAASVARLAHAFREDLHFAREADLPAVEPGQPIVLVVSSDSGRQIRYELDGHRATRVDTDGANDTNHDTFHFPPETQLSFEREGKGLLRLAIKMPRVGAGVGPEPTAASARPVQRLAIEAAPARPLRRGPSGGPGEANSQ
jgi:prepilin-type N-terminal cleavage/methylation domain-containing protein